MYASQVFIMHLENRSSAIINVNINKYNTQYSIYRRAVYACSLVRTCDTAHILTKQLL